MSSLRLLAWFTGRPFLRGVSALAFGTAAGQVIAILATPVLTRLYPAAEIGKLGLFAAYLGFAAVSVALGLDQALVSATEEDSDALTALALLVVAPMSVLSALVALGLISFHWMGLGELSRWSVLLILVGSLLNGWLFVFRFVWVKRQEFGPIQRIPVSQNFGRALGQLSLFHFGWFGLFTGELLGRGLGLKTAARGVLERLRFLPLLSSPGLARSLVGRYREFPLYIFPSCFIGTVAQNLPVFFIADYFGLAAAGYYALLQRVIALPMTLIGSSVADVFHGRFAAVVRIPDSNPKKLFLKVCGGLILIGVVPTLAVMKWGPEIFSFVLGRNWREAGVYAVYIAPWALCQLAVSPVSRVLAVIEGKAMKFIYDGASLLGTIIVFVAAHRLRTSIYSALLALSVMNVITYVIYFMILLRAVARHRNATHQVSYVVAAGEA